jgi:hypothetical protein
MRQNILDAFVTFQITDLDDDMVGMCKALVDWMKVIRAEFPDESLPAATPPDRFYKMNPHQPKMELRKNLRKMMAHACKYQQDPDETVQILNVYVVILAATYLYHMPTEQMVDAAKQSSVFTRDAAQQMLLDDEMSPNWLKEPSGKDFTAIML